MIAIFSDFLEQSIKVFMDDFSIFRDSYETCLTNLEVVLKRCEETILVFNWEKCHFIVTEGILLGHKVSKDGLNVNKVKIETIENCLHQLM